MKILTITGQCQSSDESTNYYYSIEFREPGLSLLIDLVKEFKHINGIGEVKKIIYDNNFIDCKISMDEDDFSNDIKISHSHIEVEDIHFTLNLKDNFSTTIYETNYFSLNQLEEIKESL